MHQAIHNAPKIFKLSNSITLILDKIVSVESVAVSVWLGIGSRFESKEQSGISHFLEHMAFKGTNTRDAKQIAEAFDDLGVYFNAHTSREHTAYYAKAAKEDLSTVVDLIADILLNSIFLKEEIERERSVILQEIGRTNDTPDDLIFDKYIEACYPDQPFGRSILGQIETVNNFTRQDFIDYTQKHYVASNTVISLAGNFSNDEAMCELFEKKFSAMPHSNAASFAAPAVYKPGKYIVNKELEQVQLVLAWPSIDNGSLSGNIRPVITTNLFSSVFGGGMSSRLFQRIREQLGLAYSVYSFLSAYNDTGVFSIYAGIAPEKVASAIGEIRTEITKAISITDDELRRAKKQYVVPLRMLSENTMSVCKYNGRNFITHHKIYTIEEVLDIVEQITKKELEQCAQQILSEASKVTCAVIGRVSPQSIETVLSQEFGNVQNS